MKILHNFITWLFHTFVTIKNIKISRRNIIGKHHSDCHIRWAHWAAPIIQQTEYVKRKYSRMSFGNRVHGKYSKPEFRIFKDLSMSSAYKKVRWKSWGRLSKRKFLVHVQYSNICTLRSKFLTYRFSGEALWAIIDMSPFWPVIENRL